MKRFVSVLLTLALLLSLAPTVSAAEPGFENFTKANSYAAGQFADVPAGAWYEANIVLAYELGLAKGKSDTAFAPSGSVTIAETLAFASRLHSIYLGGSGEFVQGSPWYQVYVDYAKANGIISDTSATVGANSGSAATTAAPYDYNATATRAQFASILAKALPSEALPAINSIAKGVLPDVPTNADYAESVYTLYRAGILTGNDKFGTFKPESNIQRSEVATIVARMAQEGQRRTFTLETSAHERIHELLPDSEFYYTDETEALAPYYEAADARREAILNSPTEIVKSDEFIRGETYTGTAYYVSPNGDDSNDGLTPETAWKTPQRATWDEVGAGDAVFFERGQIFRLGEFDFTVKTDVTYSAYGEGAKPVFTLVKENSARAECWQLCFSDDSSKKIWKFYEKTGDVGGIVFNDSSYAERVIEWPTPDGYLATETIERDATGSYHPMMDERSAQRLVSAGEYRSVEDALANDLTYVSRMDLTDLSYPIDYRLVNDSVELYLRCDAGNPGEVYSDIEVLAVIGERDDPQTWIVDPRGADGYVLDNLSFKWFLDNAVGGFLDSSKDVVIQNCTVEWGGNRLHTITSAEPTTDHFMLGDGIYNVVCNAVIRDCYMRHASNGATFESSQAMAGSFGTYLAEGNLIENCTQGLRTYLGGADDVGRIEKLILRDNIILDSGNGLGVEWESPCAIDLSLNFLQFAKEIEIYDNVMIGSTLALIVRPESTAVECDIHHNVFAQPRDGLLMLEGANWWKIADAK